MGFQLRQQRPGGSQDLFVTVCPRRDEVLAKPRLPHVGFDFLGVQDLNRRVAARLQPTSHQFTQRLVGLAYGVTHRIRDPCGCARCQRSDNYFKSGHC